MTGEVVLSAALRSNLLSLQRTQGSIDKVQNILSTGLKVSSALDNPQNFFASQSLKNRSSDLTTLLDGIGQSIQTVKAADAGVTSLTSLVKQAQSIVSSARDAISNGSKEASVTGTTNLKGVTDLTTVTGVGTTGVIRFDIVNADGLALTPSTSSGVGGIAIAAGDSIEQLIAKINDLTDATGSTSPTNGKQILKAELTSAGNLKITALEGLSFSVNFDADGDAAAGETAANSVVDSALASALGFGGIAKSQAAESTTLFTTGFTATASTKLTSGTFYTATVGTKASASTLLTAVRDTDGGSTARFINNATGGTSYNITINDKTVVNLATDSTTTIQGLVDLINNDSTLKGFIKAGYDATTGKFTVESISASTQTVKIGITDGSNVATTDKADFDFGVKATFTPAADTAGSAENFVLATAASTLSQYESDYNTVLSNIDTLVSDAGYRGVNLLGGDTLDTYFNEDRSNKLSTTGKDLSSSGLNLTKADFSRLDTITAADTKIQAALSTVRGFGGQLSNSLSIIQTREDFTKSLVATLNEGSDKLTVADQNEEGAKLLALQTRQQLGVTALSLASQAQQSVLKLF